MPASSGEGIDGEVHAFPPSMAQEAFFYLEKLNPGNAPFNIAVRFQLRGPVDVGLLKRAFAAIIERQETLRTQLEEEDGELSQIVLPTAGMPFEFLDLSKVPPGEREAQLRELGAAEATKTFSIAEAPLLRAALAKVADEEFLLYVSIHHAIADGWSIGILTRELAAFYEGFATGRPPALPPLPIQYADFSVWQRDYLQGPEIAKQMDYWRTQLNGLQEAELATDFPRPSVKKWNGNIVSVELADDLAARLQEIAAGAGATLFHIFLAAYNILLRQKTDSEDIVIGVPVAGRDRQELEGVIGTFINSVILRTDLSGNPSFLTLLGKVRDLAVAAMENHEVPFEMLVRELKPQRHSGRNPLFQINYTHQRDFVHPEDFAGIQLTAIPSLSSGAIFDLHFFTVQRDGKWRLSCDYCTDLFERATAERMLRQFCCLLESVAGNPDCPLEELNLSDETERKQLMAWSGITTDFPETSIGALFASVATRVPHKTALLQQEHAISYQEVLRRASALARDLGNLPTGTPVGIFTSGSLEVIVGLVGILLAGGAYVPLDPSLPEERIGFLVKDAGISVIVADRTVLVGVENCRVVHVPEGEGIVEAPMPASPAASDPAYILYTSGSTGRPKGVVVPHRAVIRLVRGADYMDFREDEIFLQAAPLSFDASTFEIWGALLNGATLVVPPPGSYALDTIAGCIQNHKVTTLWLTSGLFQAMVDDHLEELAGLRNLLAGGDVLSIPHLRRAMAALPGTRFINGYGPTENTTFTTCHTIHASDLHLISVPIGKPIANSSVFILDDSMRLAPIGMPGEIYTGGDGLAIGYLNDPERTKAVFSDAKIPGAGRLYRTGDRGYWREDGTIIFQGRRDRQVKIRGVRVEPGEVEAALLAHPNVAECHVGIRGRSASSKILVAWIRPAGALDREEVMDSLSAKLPAFLRPDAIVPVEHFPLTVSGKLDMTALPDPDVSTRTKSELPETETEKRLAAIWAELLEVSDVRRDDNFFYLGGHSLLALRLFSRIRTDFGITLPLATLLRAPSLRMLGSFLDRELSEGDEGAASAPVLAVIHAEGAKAPLFCIHAGDGGVLVYKELMHHLDGSRPVLGIESPALQVGKNYRVPTIEEAAALYVKTIQRRRPHGPYLLAGLSYGGAVAYEMALQLQEEGEEVAFLALFDTWAPGVRMIKVGLAERLHRYYRRKGAEGFFAKVFQTAIYFSLRTWQRVFPRTEVPPAPDPNDLQRELREAHGETMRVYRPRPYSGKVTLFRAMDPGGCVFDFPEDNGWNAWVGELEIIPANGTHDTLFDGRNIGDLGKKFQACLQACRA
ncbi:MAG: amino acid adenylation domain-containing protein [Chthoniobacterales bacterium]|nr:amino acid adenylation domain-containing protein [Chthoniobacterales bacterium]